MTTIPLRGLHSVEGGEDVVNNGGGIRLSGHPVVEEESIEEWDEVNVDAEEVHGPHVENPSEDPALAKNCFNLLFKIITLHRHLPYQYCFILIIIYYR